MVWRMAEVFGNTSWSKQRSFGSKHHVKKNAGINQAGSKATSSICDLIAAELTWKRLPSQLREFLCLRLSWECKNPQRTPSHHEHQLEKSSNSIGFGSLHRFFSSVLFSKWRASPLLNGHFPVASATLPQPKLRPGSPSASDTAVSGPSPHRIVVWNLLMEEFLHQLINIPLFTWFHRCQVVQISSISPKYVFAFTIQCSFHEVTKRIPAAVLIQMQHMSFASHRS